MNNKHYLQLVSTLIATPELLTPDLLGSCHIPSQQLLKIIHAIPARVFWKNLDGTYVGCNTTFAKDAGYAEPNDIIGKTDFDLSWQEKADLYRDNDRKIISTGNPMPDFEQERMQPDGSLAWFVTSKTSLRNQKGETIGIIGAYHDISDKKSIEKEIKENQRKFQLFFDSSIDGMNIMDFQGNLIDLNKVSHERLGYTKEEMLAISIPKLSSPSSRAPERIRQIIEQGHAIFETESYKKDGTPLPIEVNARVIELEGQKVIFSITRDISERKLLEEQVRQSQKMEAIGTLVGGIAHDFNNILAAIKANLYIARNHLTDPAKTESKLRSIEELSDRATSMVQQLLTYARKDPVKMQHIVMNDLLKDVHNLTLAMIPENIHCKLSICSEELQIKGDSTQLHQLLINLLNNAHDAVADSTNPEISISLSPFQADETFKKKHVQQLHRQFAKLSVSDNGCGIPPEHIEHIFDPFFTTKEVGKGTGLGLSMIYGSVQTHEGSIEVETKPGEGTTFHFFFPLIEEEKEVLNKPEYTLRKGNQETILLVDDEQVLRESSTEVLENIGYKVISANNGEQAMAMIEKASPKIDLVISDVIMPIVGGHELTKNIRARNYPMPIILISGYDKTDINANLLNDELLQIMNKPIDFIQLSETIQMLLTLS